MGTKTNIPDKMIVSITYDQNGHNYELKKEIKYPVTMNDLQQILLAVDISITKEANGGIIPEMPGGWDYPSYKLLSMMNTK